MLTKNIAIGFSCAFSIFCADYANAVSVLDAVTAINLNTNSDRQMTREMSANDVLSWYQDNRLLQLTRADRADFDAAFDQQILPAGYHLNYQTFPVSDNLLPRITLQGPVVSKGGFSSQENFTLAEGLKAWSWDDDVLNRLKKANMSIDEPLRAGKPLAQTVPGEFPKSVPVRVSEIKLFLSKPTTNVAALEVEFQITPSNILALADYFGVVYSRDDVARQLSNDLGNKPSMWVNLKSLLQGWTHEWVNRFPAEKSAHDGNFANDVCHGTARQFFSEQLSNSAEYDRSTEATEWLLRASYARLSDGIEPEFGDYLYKPKMHSIRFLLKDPKSSRWIGLSSFSQSTTPYRVWWVDQDFNVTQYPPDPAVPNLEQTFDVWRPK